MTRARLYSRISIALGIIALQASFAAAQDPPAGPWTTNGPAGVEVAALASDPTNAMRLFAGTELGVFRSDDGGGTWTSAPTGSSNVLALAFDPANPNRLWAGTNTGIAESADGGTTFVDRDGFGPVRAIAVDPGDPSTIYVAGDGHNVSKSTDGGATWKDTITDPLVRRIAALVIDPADRSHLVAAVADADYAYFPFFRQPQVIETRDAGETWKMLLGLNFGPGSDAVAFDPRGNGVIYAAVGSQVYRSADGGEAWTTSPFSSLGFTVRSLLIDPREPETIYSGTDVGAFRSADAGTHWEQLRGSVVPVRALAFDTDRAVLHAATENGVWEFAMTPAAPSAPCQDSAGALCLLGGRFSARVDAWDPRTGSYTSGNAVFETDGFGYFSFPSLTGDASLPEVLVKMVDAAAPPWRSDWVFWGSLTDVDFLLTVTDTSTGGSRTYASSSSPFCGGADTQAFPSRPAGDFTSAPSRRREGSGDTVTLLGGRLEVQMTASDPRTGEPLAGTAVAGVDDRSGYFSLPSLTGDATLPEVVVKAIDATPLTGTFWFFYSGMTSLPYTINVRNTVTGETISSPSAGPFCGAADTQIAAADFRIFGRVSDWESPMAISGATVTLEQGSRRESVVTGPNGRYQFLGIPGGPAHLHAEAAEFFPFDRQWTVTSDTEVNITLSSP